MINYSRLGYSVKREILNFTKKICKGLKKPEFKLISNMLYGICESNSCHLSKISRSLKEDITLKKTIERLSCGLNSFADNQALLDNYTNVVNHTLTTRRYLLLTVQMLQSHTVQNLRG
jgi:hypothetical protein